MSRAALAHTVNGFFDSFRSKPAVAARPASRASQVKVESRYNEGDDESLLESATSLPRPTLKALEKAIRADGFKGALVSGWSQGQRGGFTVHYGGEKHEFEISENTTPRPVGEIGRLVKESGRYDKNGRRTGILSDGTRVNVYQYSPDEWTAALHYPDGGYSALVMSGGSFEFDEHNVEGAHMGKLTSWDAVPPNIKLDIEQHAVESSMVANGDAKKYESGSGPYTVYFETGTLVGGDKTIYHLRRPTLKAAKIEALAQEKLRGGVISVTHKGREVWDTSESSHQPNGRGIYHETAVAKHDMVLVPDHRGRWRIDLVTSAGGNHIDVTQHQAGTAGNSGYSSPELAFRSALDIQRARGIRGKSHVWIADRDGGLTDYEPMERNGRATTVDPVAARELDLYIANTFELVGAVNSIGKSIDANLKRKVASGKYDSALAPKAWQHLVDEGAKRYQKEFGSDSPIFNAATRRQVAEDFARAWESDSGMQPNASKKTIRFVRAGQVERWQPSRKGYVWHEGYSEDGNTQPYLTRREAQESAKSRGARAVFEG